MIKGFIIIVPFSIDIVLSFACRDAADASTIKRPRDTCGACCVWRCRTPISSRKSLIVIRLSSLLPYVEVELLAARTVQQSSLDVPGIDRPRRDALVVGYVDVQGSAAGNFRP